jgi:hypothetical protein
LHTKGDFIISLDRTNKEKRQAKEQKQLYMNMNIATISLLLLLASTANVAQSGVFDLQKYGAKPGRDITQVLFFFFF